MMLIEITDFFLPSAKNDARESDRRANGDEDEDEGNDDHSSLDRSLTFRSCSFNMLTTLISECMGNEHRLIAGFSFRLVW